MEKTVYTNIKELLWWDSPLFIKDKNTGVNHIIIEYLDETYNIVDFLNYSLFVEYSKAYDDILSKYEDYLKIKSIFEYAYPGIKETYQPILKIIYEYEDYPDDNTLVEALLKEYQSQINTMQYNICEWEKVMAAWYTQIKDNPQEALLDIFKE
jgi:hypothetical protein